MTARFEELRIEKDKRQGDIANILKVKRNTYSKWENEINDMPVEQANVVFILLTLKRLNLVIKKLL